MICAHDFIDAVEISALLAVATAMIAGWLINQFAEPWTKARLKPLTERARQVVQLAFA